MDKNTFVQLAKDVYRLTLLFPNKEPLRYKIREVANDIVADFIFKENNYLNDILMKLEVIDSFFEIAASQDWTSPAKTKETREGYWAAKDEIDGMIRRAGDVASEMEAEKEKRTDFILVHEEAKKEEIAAAPGKIIEVPVMPKPMIVPEPAAQPAEIEKMPQSGVSLDEAVFGATGGQITAGIEDEANDDSGDESSPLTGSQVARQNRIMEFLKEKGNAQVWEIQKIFPNVSKRTIRRDFRSMLKQGVIERTGERNTTAYKIKVNLS